MALPESLLFGPGPTPVRTRETQPSGAVASLLARSAGVPPPALPGLLLSNPGVSASIDWVAHKRHVKEPDHKLITAAERYPDEQLRFYADNAHPSRRGGPASPRQGTLNSSAMAVTLNPTVPLPKEGIKCVGFHQPFPEGASRPPTASARHEGDSIRGLLSGAPSPPQPAPADAHTLRRRVVAPHLAPSTPGLAGAPYGLASPVQAPPPSAGATRNSNSLRSDAVAAAIREAGGGVAVPPPPPPPAPAVLFLPDERCSAESLRGIAGGASRPSTRTDPLSVSPPNSAALQRRLAGGSKGGGAARSRYQALLQSEGVGSLLSGGGGGGVGGLRGLDSPPPSSLDSSRRGSTAAQQQPPGAGGVGGSACYPEMRFHARAQADVAAATGSAAWSPGVPPRDPAAAAAHFSSSYSRAFAPPGGRGDAMPVRRSSVALSPANDAFKVTSIY